MLWFFSLKQVQPLCRSDISSFEPFSAVRTVVAWPSKVRVMLLAALLWSLLLRFPQKQDYSGQKAVAKRWRPRRPLTVTAAALPSMTVTRYVCGAFNVQYLWFCSACSLCFSSLLIWADLRYADFKCTMVRLRLWSILSLCMMCLLSRSNNWNWLNS